MSFLSNRLNQVCLTVLWKVCLSLNLLLMCDIAVASAGDDSV